MERRFLYKEAYLLILHLFLAAWGQWKQAVKTTLTLNKVDMVCLHHALEHFDIKEAIDVLYDI